MMFNEFGSDRLNEFFEALSSNALPKSEGIVVGGLVRLQQGILEVSPDSIAYSAWYEVPREIIEAVACDGKRKCADREYPHVQLLLKVTGDSFTTFAADFAKAAVLKTNYCATCKNGHKENIEAFGDIDANIQAAAMCFKQTADPSYGLRLGKCD